MISKPLDWHGSSMIPGRAGEAFGPPKPLISNNNWYFDYGLRLTNWTVIVNLKAAISGFKKSGGDMS